MNKIIDDPEKFKQTAWYLESQFHTGHPAIEHLGNILKLLSYDDYDEVTTERVRAYCQYHKLLNGSLGEHDLQMEMWKVNEILDAYNE